MRDLAGRTALITGAASGIGLGMARAFAGRGMRLILADLDADALDAARRELEGIGAVVRVRPTDVSRREDVRALADEAAAWGDLHVLCNNAGVSHPGLPLDQASEDHWDWMIGVNLMGVIHGLQFLLPLITRHGQGGHVVNTASIGGLNVHPDFHYGAYNTTKFAVVGLSEALKIDLAPHGIGVSVLCPAAVNTAIFESGRVRPERFGGSFARDDDHPIRALLRAGADPDVIGRWVVRAIRDDMFYILPHGETRGWVEARHRRILDAYDWAENVRAEVEG